MYPCNVSAEQNKDMVEPHAEDGLKVALILT